MLRRAMLTTLIAALPGVGARADAPQDGAPQDGAPLDEALARAGWRHENYPGMRPGRFRAAPQDGVAISASAGGSFIWRPLGGAPACLSWRWRVDEGPPPTDLTRRGGEDRAISLTIGFAGWPTRATLWQRTQHAFAQSAAGAHRLPRSALIYVWGGTGDEPDAFFSPWMAGLGKVRRMRPALAPRGEWFEERVDLAGDWRRAFGGPPPPLQEIAIGTDADNTRSRVAARVDQIRLNACPTD